MKYTEFLEYIYERHSGNVKLGLDRMKSILEAMGNPNRKLKGIHVGGTNGKGSTCAILEALFLASGFRTGLNTSPHLVDYRERIRLNGSEISESELIELYSDWEQVFSVNEASFFEITTAMAFRYFYEQQVEAAIFEVGLGGRLDGTNPFMAEIAAITTISLDHVKSLGGTIRKIAWEKAGIIKKDQDVVLGFINEEAIREITRVCEEKGGRISALGRDFMVSDIKTGSDGTRFDYEDENVTWKGLSVNLSGAYQANNAAVALRAYITWMKNRNLKISEQLVSKALRGIHWRGRLQILQREPLVIIDGAHNEEGIGLLVDSIKRIYSGRRIIFVLAILRDKNLQVMIKRVCEVSDKLIISKNKSKRAAEIEEQVMIAERYKADYETARDVVSATKRALSMARKDDVVIISGSLYTISEVLAEKMFEEN
jgi:dihydrofolate synthase / folylpolyglutamate synthase